jgi:hypothetical protein
LRRDFHAEIRVKWCLQNPEAVSSIISLKMHKNPSEQPLKV